jgi:hypothetical protein
VQALAKQFLCVGDEVWLLDNQESPGGKLFKEYVRNAAGKVGFGATTKQGVYAMTPDGEFLAGHFAAHNKAATMQLLRDALKLWNETAAKKNLKAKPIPVKLQNRTWTNGLERTAGGDVGAKAGLILQVLVRDLPFKGEEKPGPAAYQGAYNQTWVDLSVQEMQDLLPKGGAKSVVPEALFRKIARESLLDFVRGQTDPWPDGAIRKAVLTVEPIGNGAVRYQGEFQAQEGRRSFDAKLHGKAVFDSGAGRFRSFELVAAGMRSGSTATNFRFQEPPSPLGVAFIIEDQYDKTKPKAEAAKPIASKPAESKPAVDPALVAERDARLRARVAEDLKAGRKTPFTVSVMGSAAEIVSLDETGGTVRMSSGGSVFDLLWADFTLQDRRNLAVARIRPARPAEDVALAAFYHLACGDARGAEAYLRGLPPAEAEALRGTVKP